MKKLIGFLFLVMIINSAFLADIKESDVPEAVKQSFKKLYPNSYVYEWEFKKKSNIYEAEFYLKGEKYKSYFDAQGEWQKTEIEVKNKALPEVISKQLAQTKYANWKIDDVKRQLTPKTKNVIYIVEVEQGKQETWLSFSLDGKLLSEQPKK